MDSPLHFLVSKFLLSSKDACYSASLPPDKELNETTYRKHSAHKRIFCCYISSWMPFILSITIIPSASSSHSFHEYLDKYQQSRQWFVFQKGQTGGNRQKKQDESEWEKQVRHIIPSTFTRHYSTWLYGVIIKACLSNVPSIMRPGYHWKTHPLQTEHWLWPGKFQIIIVVVGDTVEWLPQDRSICLKSEIS